MGLPVEVNPLFLENQYAIQRSLRFRQGSSNNAYLSRTPAAASNRTTWTWSGWVKRGALGVDSALLSTSDSTSAGYNQNSFRFLSTDNIRFTQTDNIGANTLLIDTSAVFRDPSSFYHIVLAVDTTSATNTITGTSTDRVRLYVNGVQISAFSATTVPAINLNTFINNSQPQYIGRRGSISPTNYFDGYLAEVNFIDGLALTPSSFGQYNEFGVWSAQKYGGAYGTNGFYLPFNDPTSATTLCYDRQLGYADTSKNNWTPNNISTTAGVTYDAMTDVPPPSTIQNVAAGNYCVLNPLNKNASSITVLNGNLGISTSAVNVGVAGTFGVSSGKWYWENTFTNASGVPSIGAAPATWDKTYVGSASGGGIGYHANGAIYSNGTSVQGVPTYTSGDVISVAIDLDAGSISFFRNNVQAGTTITGLTGTWFPAIAGQTSSTLASNFGQRPFSYTPPSGFRPLNSNNLPAPTIPNGAKVMAATTYTGNGTSQSAVNTVNGVGSMRPDFLWIKGRSGATDHQLLDTVRGATSVLVSNLTSAETVYGAAQVAFNANGFLVGGLATMNTNAATYVGWQWNAGSGTTSSNTDGSITSTVSVNKSAGFSIATFTAPASGQFTVGHGLGVTPSLVIVKPRSQAGSWFVYSPAGVNNTTFLVLNTTAAAATFSTMWGASGMTSSTVGLTVGGATYASATHVVYSWAPVAGYSAFGSYTGNGSADGPFVYTGFRPRWVMIKKTSAVDDWVILDTSRNTYNVVTNWLFPNLSNAELTAATTPDVLSNGFKLRSTSGATNASGATFVYVAFAENPFKLALAR